MCVGGGQGTRGWGGGSGVLLIVFVWTVKCVAAVWRLAAVCQDHRRQQHHRRQHRHSPTHHQRSGACNIMARMGCVGVSVGERGRGTRGWGAAIVIV